jgi:hypothetical protein
MSGDIINPGWPVLENLQKLLPLDNESLQQIIDYSVSLSPSQAAEHLKNLLGDSEAAFDFISHFNSVRIPKDGPSEAGKSQPHNSRISINDDAVPVEPVPKASGHKRGKKKFAELNKLPPPRQVQGHGNLEGAYIKHDRDDYVKAAPKSPRFDVSPGPASSLDVTPSASKSVTPAREASPAPPARTNKLPPSALGSLISDLPNIKTKTKAARINITGGTPMKGASTALTDLDSAIRALEIQTNPSLAPSAQENAKRKCDCMGSRHALLTAAPNCLHCGKIICVKEGIGPCTFCGSPLLDAENIDSMLYVLKEERGREKQAIGNAAHKRAEVSRTPRPFSTPKYDSGSEDVGVSTSNGATLSLAEQHRDKLLAFQAQNAKRTRIHDEAADFETPSAGVNIWASPVERALQLKRQQKALREQEWNARPDWEKKKVVASIDIVGGKAVKRIQTVQKRTPSPDSEDDVVSEVKHLNTNDKGSFGRNPLLGGLIRPMARVQGKANGPAVEAAKSWRRVQDDNDDNERWILDGGLRGRSGADEATDEPPCG